MELSPIEITALDYSMLLSILLCIVESLKHSLELVRQIGFRRCNI